MTRFLPRTPLPLILLASSACSQAEAGRTDSIADLAGSVAGADVETEACRTYATSGGLTLGDESGSLACAYHEEGNRLACQSELGGIERDQSVTYESLADFVEEARRVGKTTSVSETQVEEGRLETTVHGYDELGRLIRTSVLRPDGESREALYDHDDFGRPRHGVLSQELAGISCGNVAISIEYDDVGRSVTRAFRPEPGNRCGFEARTDVDRYDEAGNLVAAQVRPDATATPLETTVRSRATVCR